jgi:hypothetical protein
MSNRIIWTDEQIEVLVASKYSGNVHEEEVEEGKQCQNNDYILVFAPYTRIHLLHQASEIFIDGTFGTLYCVPPFCPDSFSTGQIWGETATACRIPASNSKGNGYLTFVTNPVFFRAVTIYYASGSDL